MGEEAAQAIYEQGVCLEVYVENLPEDGLLWTGQTDAGISCSASASAGGIKVLFRAHGWREIGWAADGTGYKGTESGGTDSSNQFCRMRWGSVRFQPLSR